jgi:prevent-host-death family protein
LIYEAIVATIKIKVAMKRINKMISAGIKEVKDNLSRYLSSVKTGEVVVITERGKPIARIVKENQGRKSIHEALEPLIREGLIALPTARLKKESVSSPHETIPGKPVSDMVIEDRR